MSIYDYKFQTRKGEEKSMEEYKGKVLIIVNTATGCGFTPQYEDLQKIYEKYNEKGLEILDFPCNQFGAQAPGSYDDIHNFCTGNYGITFPQFAKINVNGSNASPLYVWLKSKKPGDIQWNFTKFLVNRNGEVINRFEPNNPMSAVESAVKKAL